MIIANVFGFFIFVYLLWKKLKDDYIPEKIFNLAFIILASLGVSSIISKLFLPDFWFWTQFLAIVGAYLVVIKRQKIKFFESLEGLVIGFLPWLSLIFLSDSIKSSSIYSFLAFWVSLILVFLYFFISASYKSFAFYKSGKIGIASVLILLIFFVVRGLTSLVFGSIVSFAGGLEIYFSGLVILVSLLLLFKLIKIDN